ncbi:MAG: DUF721 domain-containing protein [Coriobacteriia bacterium]|nr:DUF721 domain-containing protein [Coriobacteriia bacterium]
MSRRADRESQDTTVGDAAYGVLQRLDRGGNIERAKAVAAWREIAGDDVSAHAMGYAMREGELVVYVDSPAWATELAALSEQYRSGINTALGKELVSTMRFAVSKKVSEERAWEDARAREEAETRHELVTPVPASSQERSQIEAMAAQIHDGALREAAVRAAVRGLEWRKGMEARKTPQRATGALQDPDSGSEH